MHELFDKLGAAARRAAGSVATEVSVAAEKQHLSDAYRDLGKRYYEAWKRGETPELSVEMAKIDALLARIAQLQDRRNVTDVDTEPAAAPEAAPAAEESDFIQE